MTRRLGKLRVPDDFGHYISAQLRENPMQVLPVYLSHALRVGTLPDYHQDPFDRLLLAQAEVEALPLVSMGQDTSRYPVETIR